MTDKEEYRHIAFAEIAQTFSTLSHCVSHKVAAVAVKDGRIIATGINGTPTGTPNCDELFDTNFNAEDHHTFSDKYEIHAEMNVILTAAKNGISLDGSSLYCTLFPCRQCVKNLAMSGIKRIFYIDKYKRMSDEETIDIEKFCFNSGISLQQIDVNK